MRYVALLRGINVGGNNIIKMVELKACFEKMGCTNVSTYIQSGNVVFDAKEKKRETLTKNIEHTLSKQFGYTAVVVIVSHAELKKIVSTAPNGFGTKPDLYRYDVVFIKPPLKSAAAIQDIRTRDGVDLVVAGRGVLYFSRLIKNVSKSYMSKIVLLPVYKQMTIRNWNTTSKILGLMEKE